MRSWVVLSVAGVAAVSLLATSAGLVAQSRRAAAAEAHNLELESELERLRGEVARRQDELAALPRDPLDLLVDGLAGLRRTVEDGRVPGAECLPSMADPVGTGVPPGDRGGFVDDPEGLVAALRDQIAEVRELEWRSPVDLRLVDDEEFRARRDELREEGAPGLLDGTQRLLAALGAIPAGTDLAELRADLDDEQFGGYYLPGTDEGVVRVPEDGDLGAFGRLAVVHELQHALADQALGLPDAEARWQEGGVDAVMASRAVVEGDATLSDMRWAQEHASLPEQLAATLSAVQVSAVAALAHVPPYVRAELLFPYAAGLDWACRRWVDDGWEAVDAAYEDPPSTTAEILHDRPVEVQRPAMLLTPGPGYRRLVTEDFGAAQLSWLFAAPGGNEDRALSDPVGRTQAWAGGRATVWGRDTATAVGLAFVDDDGTLCGSLEEWYDASFPDATAQPAGASITFTDDEQAALLRCVDADVRLGIGPDLETATTIVDSGSASD